MSDWVFLTNHLRALHCVAVHPGIRIVEIAEHVGVRERAAHRLVTDLVEGGYLTRRRVGSRNVYELHPAMPLRREGLEDVPVGRILEVLGSAGTEPARSAEAPTDSSPATKRRENGALRGTKRSRP